MLRIIIGFAFSIAAFGQTPSFDAATIKPSPPPEMGRMFVNIEGGPGSKDPGLFKCTNCTVSMLVMQAYDLQRFQFSGPDSINSERFEIVARVPAGATKDQFRLMMQGLLAERFKMTVHREKKEMQMYDLVVAKNGPKLQEAAPTDPNDDASAAPPPPPPPGVRMPMDKNGFPAIKTIPGRPVTMITPGRMMSKGTAVTMEDFAKFMANNVGGKPVSDATGLKGKYDYTLTWAPDAGMMGMMPPPPGGHGEPPPAPVDAEPLPNVFTAIQEQLGLKLEAKKGMVDYLMIDHVEKAPTEN